MINPKYTPTQADTCGKIEFIHFNSELLLKSKKEEPFRMILSWVTENQKYAVDGFLTKRGYLSNYYRFMFLYKYPNFKNIIKKNIRIECSLFQNFDTKDALLNLTENFESSILMKVDDFRGDIRKL